MSAALNAPAESVVTCCRLPVTGLITVTFALGTAPPLGSVTDPVIEPKVDCARAGKWSAGRMNAVQSAQTSFAEREFFVMFREPGLSGVSTWPPTRHLPKICEFG